MGGPTLYREGDLEPPGTRPAKPLVADAPPSTLSSPPPRLCCPVRPFRTGSGSSCEMQGATFEVRPWRTRAVCCGVPSVSVAALRGRGWRRGEGVRSPLSLCALPALGVSLPVHAPRAETRAFVLRCTHRTRPRGPVAHDSAPRTLPGERAAPERRLGLNLCSPSSP